VSRERVSLLLRLAAPYVAVIIFWIGFRNAWLALLAYHAQILFWSRRTSFWFQRPREMRDLLFALPTAVAGPFLYVFLSFAVDVDVAAWLADHHLTGAALVLMIPYFGLVHPFLEQRHWAPLREATPLAHPLFAGYHMLVLYSLLTAPWLILCFTVLMTASVAWRAMDRREFGYAVPLSHALADLGIVIVAWLSV